MIEFIFNKTFRLLTEHPHLLIGDHEQSLLNKVTTDRRHYTYINFYAIDAEQQINEKQQVIRNYIDDISQLSNRLQRISSPDMETQTFVNELSDILLSLESKKNKLTQLKTKIPEGMLDTKRALYAAKQASLSDSSEEDVALKNRLVTLTDFMTHANKEYNRIIKQGGSINVILFETTRLYWIKLCENTNHLHSIIDYINRCAQLTTIGQLVQRCLHSSLQKIPSTNQINRALNLLSTTTPNLMNRNHWMSQIAFSSVNGRKTCQFLQKSGQSFFHMPHSEEMYHIDYDPQCDLADTGGNCFGESLMFIHALSIGRFKRLCPEAGIINFQLDQTRKLAFQKILIGQGETHVSEKSEHQSLQWEDVKNVLIENPHFKPGDLCGIFFSMNEYTRAKRRFTPGHIAVIAKLDITQSPYKYVVFEKEIGVFGLVDDASLEYIISQQIMAIYEGMNYSKIDLTKYGEASPSTYQFISKIKPITADAPATRRPDAPNVHSFFEAVKPLSSHDSSIDGAISPIV